jgi:hypothetical protein
MYGRCFSYERKGYIYGMHGPQLFMPKIAFPNFTSLYNMLTYVEDALQVVVLMSEKWYETSEIEPINAIIEENVGQLM